MVFHRMKVLQENFDAMEGEEETRVVSEVEDEWPKASRRPLASIGLKVRLYRIFATFSRAIMSSLGCEFILLVVSPRPFPGVKCFRICRGHAQAFKKTRIVKSVINAF